MIKTTPWKKIYYVILLSAMITETFIFVPHPLTPSPKSEGACLQVGISNC